MPSSLGLAWALDPGDIPSTARRHSAPACGPEPPPVATAVRDRRAGPAHPRTSRHRLLGRAAPLPRRRRRSRIACMDPRVPRAARSTAGVAWDRVAVSVAGADRPCHLRRTSAAGRGPPRRRDPPPTGPITSGVAASLRWNLPSQRRSSGALPNPQRWTGSRRGTDRRGRALRADAYLFSVRPRAATGGPRAGLGLLRVRACLAYDARRAWPVCPRSTPGIASRRGREPRGFEQPAACTGFVRLAESGLGLGNPPPSCSYPNAAPPGLTVSGGFR